MKIETPARLHFGILRLDENAHHFGGVGVAVDRPKFVVEKIKGGRARVLHRIPSHIGLGSGTQMRLALAKIHGRKGIGGAGGKISRIGSEAFRRGGLIVDYGDRIERFAVPSGWRFVIAIPSSARKVYGKREGLLFKKALPGKRAVYLRLLSILKERMLPALRRKDIAAFGKALGEYNLTSGKYFERAQGGVYKKGATAKLVGAFLSNGAYGAGQSSWGPAAFGLSSAGKAHALEAGVKDFCKKEKIKARIFIAKAMNRGAKVIRFS